jgi:hypothetical protein
MHRRRRIFLAAAAVLVLAGCTLSTAGATGSTSAPSDTGAGSGAPLQASLSTSTVYPSTCHARDNNELPDPSCTPGATNPDVTQANIKSTICKSGWTATVRPPVSYTDKIKKEAIAAYGDYAGAAMGSYELDHLVSLEVGGSPSAVANLWPEKGEHNAKDPVENAAKVAVCSGRMSLAEAQSKIATNWIELGHELGVANIPAS